LRRTPDGHPIHSFDTLMAELGTRCRNRCRVESDPSCPTFVQMTESNAVQARAFKLLSTAQPGGRNQKDALAQLVAQGSTQDAQKSQRKTLL